MVALFDVAAALRRDVAKSTRRYGLKQCSLKFHIAIRTNNREEK